MSDIRNGERLLVLMNILNEKTDEENGLSLDQLVDELTKHFGPDFHVNKKSIKSDLDILMSAGFHINEQTVGRNKKLYSHQDRLFEIYELRMLIDAVSSARFITKKETESLIDKIKSLTSKHQAKKLQNQIYLDDRIKAENKQVRYSIDVIHRAIAERKLVSFQYGRYNVNKEFVLGREGSYYTVIPCGLVWNSDFYYLIALADGRSDDHERIHFRVDRMRKIFIEEQHYTNNEFDVVENVNKSFKMFQGRQEVIEIQCDNSLINIMIDKFGKDVPITILDDQSFKIRVNAERSEGLIGWILTWGRKVKVLSPISLVNQVKEEIMQAAQQYE